MGLHKESWGRPIGPNRIRNGQAEPVTDFLANSPLRHDKARVCLVEFALANQGRRPVWGKILANTQADSKNN